MLDDGLRAGVVASGDAASVIDALDQRSLPLASILVMHPRADRDVALSCGAIERRIKPFLQRVANTAIGSALAHDAAGRNSAGVCGALRE